MSAKVLPLVSRAREPTPLTDESLLAACATQDPAALALLFERYSKAVYRFIARMVGADQGEVDDLAQATFIEIWRAAGRYKARSTVRVWIFGIAHNVARTALRGRRRRRVALDHLAIVPSPPHRGQEEHATERELIDRLALALDTLSPNQRSAFVLCEIEELTGAEAAEVLGASPGSVGRWVHEARQKIRARMTEGAR